MGSRVTWLAVRGDDALKIKQRAEHATFSTIEGYIHATEMLDVGFGDDFAPLSSDLFTGAGDAPPALQNPSLERTRMSDRRRKMLNRRSL